MTFKQKTRRDPKPAAPGPAKQPPGKAPPPLCRSRKPRPVAAPPPLPPPPPTPFGQMTLRVRTLLETLGKDAPYTGTPIAAVEALMRQHGPFTVERLLIGARTFADLRLADMRPVRVAAPKRVIAALAIVLQVPLKPCDRCQGRYLGDQCPGHHPPVPPVPLGSSPPMSQTSSSRPASACTAASRRRSS